MHANMTCKHHMKIICVRMKKQNALKREILNPNQDWACWIAIRIYDHW